MPWNSSDRDPIEARRRQLAEQQRQLAAEMSRLTAELAQAGDHPAAPKPAEPLVWRREEDPHTTGTPELSPARKRHLAYPRQRDMVVFFVVLFLFVIVLFLVFWVMHNTAPGSGA